jgi:hypothetical protein
MRGKLPATQYRQVLMGLLFLRYVSDAFENRYRELKAEGYGDEEDRDAYMEKNIFFVPKSARWERIAAVAHEANNGETIDNAMIAIERDNSLSFLHLNSNVLVRTLSNTCSTLLCGYSYCFKNSVNILLVRSIGNHNIYLTVHFYYIRIFLLSMLAGLAECL